MGSKSSKPKNAPQATARPKLKIFQDKYETVEEVSVALKKSGLESCQLVVGIDFTKSNTWTGEISFNGKSFLSLSSLMKSGAGQSLHSLDGPPNPYLVTLSLVARTLEAFDDDHLIPCYGFGDSSTGADAVFSLKAGNEPARGLEDLLMTYRQVTPHINLAGPTSFAPIIRQAMRDVFYSGMQFTVLLIVADGQISPSCVQDTEKAIVDASQFPMSIIVIGVGDGPWDKMKEFDDRLPQRLWDNFQFVEFQKTMMASYSSPQEQREADFMLHAFMELPDQYRSAEHLIGQAAAGNVSWAVHATPDTILRNPPYDFQGLQGQ